MGTLAIIGNIVGSVGSSFSPTSLFLSAEKGAWYDPSDLSTVFQDTAATTPSVVGDPVGRINDKSGNGFHLLQATAGLRPLLQTEGGRYYLNFDGTDDEMAVTATLGFTSTMESFIGLHPVTGTTKYVIINGQGDYFYHIAVNGDVSSAASNAGTPAYKVDNVSIGTSRDNVWDALTLDTPHVIEATTLDLSTWTALRIDAYAAAWRMTGRVYGIILRQALTAAEIISVRSWMAGKTGVTL
jgi:hypothetical protein